MTRRLSYYCVTLYGGRMTIVKSSGMRKVKNVVYAEEGTNNIDSVSLATKEEIDHFLNFSGRTDEDIRIVD